MRNTILIIVDFIKDNIDKYVDRIAENNMYLEYYMM